LGDHVHKPLFQTAALRERTSAAISLAGGVLLAQVGADTLQIIDLWGELDVQVGRVAASQPAMVLGGFQRLQNPALHATESS
jgi:hypothetical protein